MSNATRYGYNCYTNFDSTSTCFCSCYCDRITGAVYNCFCECDTTSAALIISILQGVTILLTLLAAFWYFYLRPRFDYRAPLTDSRKRDQKQPSAPWQLIMSGPNRYSRMVAPMANEFIVASNSQPIKLIKNTQNSPDVKLPNPLASGVSGKDAKEGLSLQEDPQPGSHLSKTSLPIASPSN